MAEAVAPMADSVMITPIPIEYVDHYWGVVGPMLETATLESRGRWDIESVYKEIRSGGQLLWVVFESDDDILAAFTTQIYYYPLKRYASVVFCGSRGSSGMEGMAGKWVQAMNALREWAKVHGCDGVEIVGRKGWGRIFKNSGFEESFVTIEGGV